MPALPYLQPRETESPVSPEKRPYRLSLHDSSPRTSQQEGQTRSSYNVNSSDLNLQENNLNFEGTNSLCFGDTPHHFRNSLLPTPSPCRILKRTPRTQDNPGQPTWVDPLGVWLPNKKRWNQYETFTRHAHLLHRTSDMFLDPRPYIPRCSHERTLSALQRQRHRLETDEELKRQERNMRIIERVKQIRDMWDKWSNKADALGAEHKNRLNNFRKIRDDYTDPEDVIRKKREERIKHERELYEERERKKQEELEKKRFKIPKIIITQYEEDLQQNEELEELSESKVTNSVNIPRVSENEEDRVEAEMENRGRRGSNLEVPERESLADDLYYEENLQIENEQENCEHGNMGDNVEDGNFASLESHGNNFASLESNGNNFASLESHGNNLAVELENVVLEDKSPKSLGSVVESQLDSISEPGSVLLAQGSVSSTAEELNTQQRTDLDTFKKESESEASSNYSGNSGKLEKNGSEKGSGKGSGKGSESTLKSEEKQMDFLRPPHVSVVLGEIIPDDGSIGDADDTASLMAAFTPVPLGVSNGIVPGDAMRASSVVDRYHVPSQARLNNTKEGKNGGAWKPKISDKKQFLEIDLGAVTNVMQVASQGYPIGSQKMQKKEKCWVESYTLSLSTDGSSWHQCTENGAVKVFKGNKDNNSVVLNSIPTPMEARFVRFIPQTWKNSIAMRVEVYGEVLEPELSSVTPPPYDRPVEAILEEEEEAHVKEFMCSVEKEQDFDEQNAWEECTVNSVVETASQIQGRVATVSQSPLLELTVQGEKQSSKTKRKPKKPKEEKHEEKAEKNVKKKKKKKVKEKKTKLPPVVSSLSALEDVEEEEDGHSSGDEQEEEEERFLSSPPLPEIPKRPDSVKRMPPAPKRSFSMFPVRKESQEEPSKPRRRRAQTDDSIRNELQRQQLAEDRRHKLLAAMGKTKKEVQAQSPVFDDFGAYGGLDDFLEEYCIIKEGQAKHYRRIFNTFDEDKDGFLFAEDVLEALESVNSHLLSDSHLNYIYRVLELCDCSLDSGADFKLFSVIAAFSQRVAVLDEFAKILISNLDFKELDYKLQRAKRLFLCYVDEETKTISLEELMLGLTAGGLTADQKEQTLQVLGKTASLDFLDFLTYIPLFIHIHDHILQDPVGTVVYRSYLTA